MDFKESDFKFESHGTVDIAPCKALKKLEKALSGRNTLPNVKLFIETGIPVSEVFTGFDGCGQEFCIYMKSVKVVMQKPT